MGALIIVGLTDKSVGSVYFVSVCLSDEIRVYKRTGGRELALYCLDLNKSLDFF